MSGAGGIRLRAGGGEPSSPSSRFGWFPRVTSPAAGAGGGGGWLWLRQRGSSRCFRFVLSMGWARSL
jgi:hypothetical protein